MTVPTTDWTSRLHRFLRSWQAPAALGVVLLIAAAVWLIPRPVEHVVPVDNTADWPNREAPPSREIVWQPAEPLLIDVQGAPLYPEDTQAELVTPRLTADGTRLHFSRRIDGTQSDIYVSEKIDGEWRSAKPVAELNTPANELGPILSPDSSQLYFYSDRPGGRGGTDIYVASHKDDGTWSKPKNLGPQVNSRAHEFDPAISPDGLSLYFASNRTDETAQQIADDQQSAIKEWTVTLRAQLDLTTFDLYRSSRDNTSGDWSPSAAIEALNRPDSTEGAPFVSPNGAFLYFASDRAARDGERRNLDLYRARFTPDGFLQPENLGPGINTADHETEPALSSEGFTIVFSSNRSGADRLYASTATEIYRETQWDDSNLKSISTPWWWLFPVVTAVLFALILLARYLRVAAASSRRVHQTPPRLGWLLSKVWPARFFLGAVLLNVVVLFLLAVWTLPEVVEAIIARSRDTLPAPDFVDDNQHQSHEDGREAHEKVADLQAVEPVEVPDLVRKVTDPISVPERNERLVPTIPVEQARALPPDKVIFQPRKPVEPIEAQNEPRPQPQLARRRPQQPKQPAELNLPDQPQPLEAIEPPKENAVARADVQLLRGQNEQPPDVPQPPQLNPLQRMRPAVAGIVEVKPIDDARNLPDAVAQKLFERNVPSRPAAAVADIENPTLEAIAEKALPLPAPARPQLDRTDAALLNPKTFSKPAEPLPPATVVKREMKVRPATANLPDGGTGAEAAPTPLDRQRPVEVAGVTVTSESPSPDIEPTEVPAELAVARTDVELDRSAPVSPKAGLGEIADRPVEALREQSAARPLSVAAAKVEVRLNDNQPADPNDNPLNQPRPRAVAQTALTSTPDENNQLELAATSTAADPEVEKKQLQIARTDKPNLEVPAAPETDLKTEPVAKRNPLQLAQSDVNEKPTIPALQDAPLKRNSPAARNITSSADGNAEQSNQLTAAADPADVTPASAEVALLRHTDEPLKLDVTVPKELTGPVTRVKHRVVIGDLADEANDAPPAFSPLANRLDRQRARATRVALAEDNVGLQSLFTLRQGETRRKYIEILGGSDTSEQAVNLGLEWLAQHQEEDGSWDLKKHNGSEKSNTAGAGLGLLPFLAAGYTHNKPGQYQKNVEAAVNWLVTHQQDNGDLLGPGDGQHMYSHGIAAIALCEAYGMSQDQELREPARKALDFIVSARHPGTGGWRYNPNEPADTSVVGWQMMALKSGEMAGLPVDKAVYEDVLRWLRNVEAKEGVSGTFGYNNRSASPAMTAEGLLSLQFMRVDRNSPRMKSGADYLLQNLPERHQSKTSYYWYYGTQVMFHMQGKYWDAWNDNLRNILVDSQIKEGEHAGTWPPRDSWEQRGGRVYATSLKLLMLEVYYRHLPLYEQLED